MLETTVFSQMNTQNLLQKGGRECADSCHGKRHDLYVWGGIHQEMALASREISEATCIVIHVLAS